MRGNGESRPYHSTEYLESLDSIDAEILTELSKCDPRNISLLAREVKRPIETVRYRYNRMERILNLELTAYIVYSKLGLKRLSVFCYLSPKQLKPAGKALENLDYWTYLARFYGVTDGYYGVYALPADQSDFLGKYLATMNQNGLLKHYAAYATGNPHVLAANFSGFDFSHHTWRFEWSKWLGELDITADTTPPGLVDPSDFSIYADRVCMKVLERLEDNSATSFVDIAAAIGLTPQDIRYHYFKHITGRGIISGFRPRILTYPRAYSNTYTLFLKFHERKSMENFANWLSSSFIALSYAKVIGEDSLIVHTYVPMVEENKMHDFLFQMSDTGLLDDYYYMPLDIGSFKAWTMRSEKFNGEGWELNQEKCLRGLREVVEQSGLASKPPVPAVQLQGSQYVSP